MTDAFGDFLQASVRTATPLALAAYGELVVERAGIINLGLEGAIIAGAFGALVGAGAGGIGLGFAAAMLAGCAATAVVAAVVLWLRADAIIAGTAVTMLALGLTGTLYRAVYGAQGAATGAANARRFLAAHCVRHPACGSGWCSRRNAASARLGRAGPIATTPHPRTSWRASSNRSATSAWILWTC